MKSKITKFVAVCLALASFGLMGCESSMDAEGPVSITVKDADGNKYPTTEIGQQIWMAKNLNVNVEGSWCYDNDPANCEKYGRLYTWDAAMKACPSGWHLPSKEEFEAFLEAVKLRTEQIVTQKKLNAEPLKNGEDMFYNHLRDASWNDGFDSFGFSALPAGIYIRSDFTEFHSLGSYAYYWSSTEGMEDTYGTFFYSRVVTYKLFIGGDSARVESNGNTEGKGHSVRCVKD